MLRSLTNNQGTWTQVVDSITGQPIPGMWDYTYDRSAAYFKNFFPYGLMYENVGYVDIVDIRDTTSSASSVFWDQAFLNDTAIRNANIAQLRNSGTMIRMLQGCTNLRTAHVECGGSRDTQNIFNGCTGLVSIYISTESGVGVNAYALCSNLREITIELTGSTPGYFLKDGHGDDFGYCALLEEVTLIHPSTVAARLCSLSEEYELFKNLAYLNHVNYMRRISDPGSASYGDVELDLMPVHGLSYRMFVGCASLMAIPPLTVSGSLTDCHEMFNGCREVISGISAAYNVLSAANPSFHNRTFTNCGIDTPQGYTELQTVPASWGGLAVG
jgi:hypothetical protein